VKDIALRLTHYADDHSAVVCLHHALIFEKDTEWSLGIDIVRIIESLVPCVVRNSCDANREELQFREDLVEVAGADLVTEKLEDVDRVDPVVVRRLVVARADFVEECKEEVVVDLEGLQEPELVEDEERDFEKSDPVPFDRKVVAREKLFLALHLETKFRWYRERLAFEVANPFAHLNLSRNKRGS
jgi:hypothetical protein